MSEDSDRRRDLYADVELGIAAEHLVESALGQRMIVDAERERRELLEELVTLDPDDFNTRSRMRAIRQRVGVLDTWQTYIASYIHAGKSAETLLQEGGSEEPEPE